MYGKTTKRKKDTTQPNRFNLKSIHTMYGDASILVAIHAFAVLSGTIYIKVGVFFDRSAPIILSNLSRYAFGLYMIV